jgi:hypothetical protein
MEAVLLSSNAYFMDKIAIGWMNLNYYYYFFGDMSTHRRGDGRFELVTSGCDLHPIEIDRLRR